MKPSFKILYWIPRILGILAILFVSMFALDSFSPERTFWQNTAAFVIHLIPSFVLLALLIFAWKCEKTGGFIMLVFSLAFSILVYEINFRRTNSIATGLFDALILGFPFILAGILFMINGHRKKKERSAIH
jgi:hypothetical protein